MIVDEIVNIIVSHPYISLFIFIVLWEIIYIFFCIETPFYKSKRKKEYISVGEYILNYKGIALCGLMLIIFSIIVVFYIIDLAIYLISNCKEVWEFGKAPIICFGSVALFIFINWAIAIFINDKAKKNIKNGGGRK